MTEATKTSAAYWDQLVKATDHDEATVRATRKARRMMNDLAMAYPLPDEFVNVMEVRA